MDATKQVIALIADAEPPLLQRVDALMHQLVQAPITAAHGGDILGPMAMEHLLTGGKRLRARLCLAAHAALRGQPDVAVGWAAACELAHNATLIHDDLQDGDKTRRGKPTTWVRHGSAQAINAGDLLLVLPFVALGHIPVDGATQALLSQTLASGIVTVIRGQATECALTAEGKIDRALYQATIRGKTAALFELPVMGAGLLAGQRDVALQRLVAPFSFLGMLFQMQDDVLDLFGNKGRDQPGSDIREGKISALVVEHLLLHPNDMDWLVSVLRQPRCETTDADVAQVIERFRSGGALQAVLAAIAHDAAQARLAVEQLGLPAMQTLLTHLLGLILRPIEHLTQAAA